MKIITWNCNMAFRKKAHIILALKPDILKSFGEHLSFIKLHDILFGYFWSLITAVDSDYKRPYLRLI